MIVHALFDINMLFNTNSGMDSRQCISLTRNSLLILMADWPEYIPITYIIKQTNTSLVSFKFEPIADTLLIRSILAVCSSFSTVHGQRY